MIKGGRRASSKRRQYYINIWDDYCLEKNRDLDDILCDYEQKRIGKKLRKFIKWYKSSISARCIMKHLLKEGFDMCAIKLKTGSKTIGLKGNITRSERLTAPHFIFTHKDHSCVRMKPIIGGTFYSSSPYPTISFSIVYNPRESTYYNEAFKVSRDGEPIPKGIKDPDSCINNKLSDFEINNLMKTTHIRIPISSIQDTNHFRNFRLDD